MTEKTEDPPATSCIQTDGIKPLRTQPHHTKPHHTKHWIPDQPGAWFMALGPALAGVIIGGPTWRGIWLLAAWTLCYCFQFSAARWLAVLSHRNHDGERHRTVGIPSGTGVPNANGATTNISNMPGIASATATATGKDTRNLATQRFASRLHTFAIPTLTYGICTAIVGIPLLVVTPTLLWWALPLLVLAALSFLAAYTRHERTLWGNAVSVACASLMCLIATSLGSKHFPNLLPHDGLMAAAAFLAAEYSSVLFVKTMIREHGHGGYIALSVVYHIVLVTAGFAVNPVWGIATCVLLARAATLPLLHRRMKPLHVGLVEMATSVMDFVVIIATI